MFQIIITEIGWGVKGLGFICIQFFHMDYGYFIVHTLGVVSVVAELIIEFDIINAALASS